MKKLPVVSTLIAFICIVILLKLGFWQFERADEKRDIADQLAQKHEKTYTSLMSALNDGEKHNYKSVSLSGKVNNEHVFLWDNRVLQGRVGYEVLAAVKTDAGKVLVNFGWLEDNSFRQATPEVKLPVNIDGEKVVLYAPAMNVLINESLIDNAQWPRVIQQPDIDELQSLLQQDLLPFLAYAKAPENYGLKNNFKPIAMTPKKHIGYAIQWFSLSVACFVIYLLALRKKLAENNDK